MKIADAIDAALEASVIGSFTRLGSAVRRRIDHWEDEAKLPSLAGRVIVITGATSGLWLESARTLVRRRASVVVVARNPEKAGAVVARLRAELPAARVDSVLAEMGDLGSVRGAADELAARYPAIHVLVHNAGSLDDVWATSPEGIEQTVASHLVGPFLLTERLLPNLRAAAPSRVLWVSSGGMYSEPLDVSALEMPEVGYDGVVAYARAKRGQVTLASFWAERLRADRIVMHAMHPGWADTPGVARSLPRFRKLTLPLLRTAADGADTLVWLASDDGEPLRTTGLFWLDRRARSLHRFGRTRRSDTPAERVRLWDWLRAKSEATRP